MGRCTSRSILRAPLRQSYLEITIGMGGGTDAAYALGVTHGLFFTAPNNFFTFDFPGLNLYIAKRNQ